MPTRSAPARRDLDAIPRCCTRCFGDRSLHAFIGRHGARGDCDFCGARGAKTVGAAALADRFAALVAGYEEPEPGTHFIPQLGQEADGESLDTLLDEDNPGLFSERLPERARRRLVQAVVSAIDDDLRWEGHGARDVDGPWVRPGREIWAGREDEPVFQTPPERWQAFVREITAGPRFTRPDPDIDPRTYLTSDLLRGLSRTLAPGTTLFRAVQGGVQVDGGLAPHPPERMGGPRPEHCQRGQRVNAPGVPMLYASRTVATVIAEVRPWVTAPVSVATLRTHRRLRLVDFSPRRARSTPPASLVREGPAEGEAPEVRMGAAGAGGAPGQVVALGPARLAVTADEVDAIVSTIGAAMARPVNPDESEVRYVPTQYVAEVVQQAGYDGVMFRSAVAQGTNVVLFDRAEATVESVALYEVRGVRYAFDLRPPPAAGTRAPRASLDDFLDF